MSADGPRVFALPDLGEGLTEAEIVEWRVAVGDLVEVDQTVVEVETAKAVVDLPCPYAGRVTALHGRPGERRPVGQPLVTVEPLATVESSPSADTGAAGSAVGEVGEPVGHAVYREEERAGSGNVLIGYGTGAARPGRRRRHAVLGVAPGPPGSAAEPEPPAGTAGSSGLVISPLVRRLARDHGLDIRRLRGTGPGGIIRRGDVTAALAAATAPAAASGPAAASAPGAASGPAAATAADVPAVDGGVPDGDVIVPLRGIRLAIAEKVSRSRREIPEVTIWVDVDATGLLETRASINAARPDAPLGVLALLARICVSALRRFPQLNARVEAERERIVQSADIHLGIAMQTDRGLVVPVLRDAQRLNAWQLGAALAATTAQARAGQLPPGRLTGGTFTLNNYGVFGVDGSTPIINHPEAALLGMGRITDKPWVVDGQLAVRKVTQLSLTFDHRVCDGAVAGGFLRHVADCVERPALLVAHL